MMVSEKILHRQFFDNLALSLFPYVPPEQSHLYEACIKQNRFKN